MPASLHDRRDIPGQRLPVGEIAANDGGGRPIERNDSLLSALSQDPEETTSEIDIFQIQTDEFTQSETRGVEKLQDGPVTTSQRRLAIGRLEQRLDLIDIKMRRNLLRHTRGRHERRRVTLQEAFATEISRKGPDRRELPGRRRRGGAAAIQLAQKLPDSLLIQLARPGLAMFGALAVEKGQILRQVAPVCQNGMTRTRSGSTG